MNRLVHLLVKMRFQLSIHYKYNIHVLNCLVTTTSGSFTDNSQQITEIGQIK